ncbi:uncharacterized protein ACNLHF_003085 [Anomaloglossus baeobatrachus]|uniref:uncharacterized protein LOC142256722 n=1 Tax=Anomaloglossus baeobatrachus TaxID=238106 RepID=UPI003F4F5659
MKSLVTLICIISALVISEYLYDPCVQTTGRAEENPRRRPSSTMKNLVTLLCVISALVGSVFSCKCYSCQSKNSTKCAVTVTNCLSNRCMTASQFFNIDKNMFHSFYKGCANETLCETKGSLVAENRKYRFNAQCCTGHLCNRHRYKLPKKSFIPNGVKCPSAVCIGTLKECKSVRKIACTGSMTRCAHFRAILKNPYGQVQKLSFKGCTDNNTCKYNFDSHIGFEVLKREYLKC